MKSKKLYYICTMKFPELEMDDEDMQESFNDIEIEKLKKYGIEYLIEIPDENNCCSHTDNINYKEVLKYKKLSELIDDFMYGFENNATDDLFEEKMDERFESLGGEYFILRMNTKTKKLSFVNKKEIENCFNNNMGIIHNQNFVSTQFNPEFYTKFQEQIIKCFGSNENGSILFFNNYRNERWDVKVVDGVVKMGTSEEQNMFFLQD